MAVFDQLLLKKYPSKGRSNVVAPFLHLSDLTFFCLMGWHDLFSTLSNLEPYLHRVMGPLCPLSLKRPHSLTTSHTMTTESLEPEARRCPDSSRVSEVTADL